jgi:hypothetical protein
MPCAPAGNGEYFVDDLSWITCRMWSLDPAVTANRHYVLRDYAQIEMLRGAAVRVTITAANVIFGT